VTKKEQEELIDIMKDEIASLKLEIKELKEEKIKVIKTSKSIRKNN